MSEFVKVLRGQVAQAHEAVSAAWQTGNEDRAGLGAARLAELLELAKRHGVDTSGWLDPAVRAFTETKAAR